MTTKVPLIDLGIQHREISDEVTSGFAAVMGTTSFILGKQVKDFEDAYAKFIGSKHCIGVANGTDAIELALRAAAIGRGDEVILPANTFIATALAVERAGATPVLVDCDPVHQLIDVGAVQAKLGPRTKAVIPVHLFGQMAALEQLSSMLENANHRGVAIIEDAAQAQGATRNGARAGNVGIAAATSFYPGKNLGAYGDAGAVTTNSDKLAAKVRALRNYGSEVKYHHPELGFNSRLDTLQAVVLLAKLARLAKWNQARRDAAARYDEMLSGVQGVELPRTAAGNEHVFHLYVVRVANRDAVLTKVNAQGIGAGIHYPVPIHLQGAFQHLGHRAGDFPVAERAAAEILSLPMFPEITPDQQARVVEVLRQALQ
jgi:dTDP-4-amino-4,6-dideoxygalactose transaminase